MNLNFEVYQTTERKGVITAYFHILDEFGLKKKPCSVSGTSIEEVLTKIEAKLIKTEDAEAKRDSTIDQLNAARTTIAERLAQRKTQ